MHYAILCYDSEAVVEGWTKAEDDAAIAKLMGVQEELKKKKKLGPVARLLPTDTAKTLRKGPQMTVTDGPFAETKEQLLGFFIVDCETEEEAMEAARALGRASSSNGSYEVRPLRVFLPNGTS
jgi:hypothetical protein